MREARSAFDSVQNRSVLCCIPCYSGSRACSQQQSWLLAPWSRIHGSLAVGMHRGGNAGCIRVLVSWRRAPMTAQSGVARKRRAHADTDAERARVLSLQRCARAQEAEAGARGDADSEDEGDAEARTSKRKRKLESRLKIAELKQSCPRPEVVEVWDVTAQDPRLLVYLKVRPLGAWRGLRPRQGLLRWQRCLGGRILVCDMNALTPARACPGALTTSVLLVSKL